MQKKRKGSCLKALLIFLFVIVLLLGGAVLLLKHVITDGSADMVTTSFFAHSADEAIRQLEKLSDEFGYENALSELTEQNTTTVDGDSYYRLQQNYQGVPVYGKTVVCVTDENGEVISVTGNVTDIESSIDLTPDISYSDAMNSAKNYNANELKLAVTDDLSGTDDGELCIFFSENDGGAYLAFSGSLTCYANTIDQYSFVVDANTGEILDVYTTLRDASATGYRASDVSRQYGFTVERLDDGRYALINGELGLVVYDLDRINSSKKLIGGSSYVVSDNNIFGDTEGESSQEVGADLLVNVSNIHEYYNSRLGFETNSGLIALYYNDSYSFGRNARGGISGDNGLLIVGHTTGADDIDVLAHEYGHIMSFTLVGWNSKAVETQAINEGLSDIFGEIAEAHVSGWNKPDWIMTGEKIDVKRSIQDPDSTGFADNISDKSIWNEYFKGEEYFYSTAISHSAYLMWNGIDGNDSKKIDTDTLAKLWYRAMLMMPADCDFSTCRQLVEWASMAVDGMTDTQRQCIAEAFDAVGIYAPEQSPEILIDCDQNVVSDAVLNVYNVGGELHPRYTVAITGTIAEHELAYSTNIISDVGFPYEDTRTVRSAKSLHLDLPDGYYTFKITDKNNPKYEYIFTVSVSDRGTEDIIELHTDFEDRLLVHITETESTEDKDETPSSIYEIAEAATGLYCKWAVSGDFDDDGSDEIYALLCTSSSDYSNGQLWHFTSTENRCVFYIEEAEFEMICDIAKTIPDWLAAEIIDTVDNIDEFISDIERRYFQRMHIAISLFLQLKARESIN